MKTPSFSPEQHLGDLATYLSHSPSPFHAVSHATRLLEGGGFTRLQEADSWPTAPGRYLVVRDGALIAWSTADGADLTNGFRIVGAHTDSPNLRVRPRPDLSSPGGALLGVEVYGGALLNSWLDRDLGLSGRVVVRTDTGLESVLVQVDEPLLRVPQLAIHLDRTITKDGLQLDPQRHMRPIWSAAPSTAPEFRVWLASVVATEASSIIAWDLMTHDLTPPSVLGVDRSMFAAGRLDNLLSCHAGLVALLAHDPEPGSPVPVLSLFDHEEVGSNTASGAAGQFLPTVLERIASVSGLDRDQWFSTLAKSLCISADGAHATHPNWPERHEPDHLVVLDCGPVLKWNADARYATDAVGAAEIRELAAELHLPLQDFVSRNDIPCGSTIGPVTSARLGIRTVDIGVAQLSMHSARELTGVLDPARFTKLLWGFFSRSTPRS